MLRKKVACLSLAATVCISGTTNVVSAMELGTAQKQSSSIKFNRIVENPKDFKEKEKEAKEYGKKLPNHREKIVTTKKEKEAFNNYELNGTRINQALREGKVDGYPIEYVEIAKEYAAEMDKVFKKREAATPDAIKVYRYTDEKQFGFERDTFFPNGSVNKEAIESLKKQIEGKNVKDKGFTSTSLAILDKYLGEQKKTIRMDIVIPRGSQTVYMDNDYAELVLPRESTIKITKVSGIVEKGKLIVKVDAELQPSK
ncbi:ADP-ribosyltransferase [Bacillus cereus group sp. BfR-BA-01347]|uniref:ADP-ribosyltransferase n=1 Tax=Bacillus cereus group sp. BfR-BA-01347 TaxID=2920310 RepID=UPI001F587728|nr:ADP-ribosyltransferase [Bacillus cereus group sp. BfR-BA-01347]